MIRILDLDNCIADDAHRIPLIDWSATDPVRRWRTYHEASTQDRLGNEELIHVPAGSAIVVFTARPQIYSTITWAWLARHHVNASMVYMRRDGDDRGSVEVKREMLFQFLWHTGVDRKGLEAYDDRAEIVEMYHSIGISAQVRKIHDRRTYTNPLMQKGT